MVLPFVLVSCITGHAPGSAVTVGQGSDNGIRNESTQQIEDAANAAMRRQGSFEMNVDGFHGLGKVTVDAKIDMGHRRIRFDMTYGLGTMAMAINNGHLYLDYDKTIAQNLGFTGSELSDAGRCLDAGAVTSAVNPAASFGGIGADASLNVFAGIAYAKAGVTTVGGVEAQQLISPDGQEYDVATRGDPLPVGGSVHNSQNNLTVTFKNWGQPVDTSKPSGCP